MGGGGEGGEREGGKEREGEGEREGERKRGGQGKGVDLGGRRLIKKKNKEKSLGAVV